MTLRRLLTRSAACLVVAWGAGPAFGQETAKLADAKPGDIRLFVAGSLRAPVAQIQGLLEQKTGHRVVMESSESRTLQAEIEAGQPFEAALLTTPVIRDMIAKGKIVAGSATDIAMVGVGVAVRGDAPKLEVTTPEGLKAAILGAHGVRRYYGVAASVPVLDNLFAKLDLADSTKDKMVRLTSGAIPPEDPLPKGQYELIINLTSAVIPMKGWTYLGPIPEQFQMPVPHAAGIGVAGDTALAKAVLETLKTPQFDAALKANGVTRP
jgi:molybdate transport system substrate-binding protein